MADVSGSCPRARDDSALPSLRIFLLGLATGVAAACIAIALTFDLSPVVRSSSAERRLAAHASDACRTSTIEDAVRAFKIASRGCERHRCGTDKIWRHHYHVAYGPQLALYLGRPNVSVLEIGVQDGLSLRLWQRLFPHHGRIAAIGYGKGKAVAKRATPGDFKSHPSNGSSSLFTMYTGDQGDAAFLRQVDADLNGHKFDVIIDDGSHVPWHQLFTLAAIFGRWLADGGIYIIGARRPHAP